MGWRFGLAQGHALTIRADRPVGRCCRCAGPSTLLLLPPQAQVLVDGVGGPSAYRMSEFSRGNQVPLGTGRLGFLCQGCLARTGAALPRGQAPSSQVLHAPRLAPPLSCLSLLATHRPYLGSYVSGQEVGDAASALSRQGLGKHRLEPALNVVHGHLQAHSPLAPVHGRRPSTDSLRQLSQRRTWQRRGHWHLLTLHSFSAGCSQLPAFGVKQRSRRRTNRRASEALGILERDLPARAC